MPGRGRRAGYWRAAEYLPLGLLLLLGCSFNQGRGLTLFPETNQLLDSAKEMRDSATPNQPLPRELNKAVLAPYTVEPGDALLVQPADLDSPVRLPADQPVLPDGTINLGRYGQIVVAGKTVSEIEAQVRAAVEAQTKNPGVITVRLVTRQSKVYYVLGDVNAPGSFQLNGRETVLDGLVAAGGLTDRASRDNIILSRPTPPNGCRIVLPVCYRQIVQLGDTTTNYQLAPGDRIYVPSRGFWDNCLKKKQCSVCDTPQTACPAGAPSCGVPANWPADHPQSPVMFGAPVTIKAPETAPPPEGSAVLVPEPQPKSRSSKGSAGRPLSRSYPGQ